MFRTIRRLTRPVSRPAALMLAWQYRKTLMMWGRSIREELSRLRGGRSDVRRWQALVPELWRSRAAAEQGLVRSIVVTDDGRAVSADDNVRFGDVDVVVIADDEVHARVVAV